MCDKSDDEMLKCRTKALLQSICYMHSTKIKLITYFYRNFYIYKKRLILILYGYRWPGASLILIRGHRHLHECAYIGDDSSEELEELMEIVAEGNTINVVSSFSKSYN